MAAPAFPTAAAAAVTVASPIAVVFDDRLLLHLTPTSTHPEQHTRILSVFHRLRTHNLLQPALARVLPCRLASEEDILRVHPPDHMHRVDSYDHRSQVQAEADGGRLLDGALARHIHLDPQSASKSTSAWGDGAFDWTVSQHRDTYAGPNTPQAARLSAGGCLQAVDALLSGAAVHAFAIVRPPGHHCHACQAGGFCFYNNIAIAARYAQSRGVVKVAIVDFDVHHGDGTQQVFYEDESVLFISLHRRDGTFYPGSGPAEDVGCGRGAGFNVNIPWPCAGLGDSEYAAAFEYVVMPLLAEFAPEMVLVSAGFDAAEGDPLGEMSLLPGAYRHMVGLLAALDPPRGVLVALEGGYNLASIGAAAEGCVQALTSAAAASVRLPARAAAAALRAREDAPLAAAAPPSPPLLLPPAVAPAPFVHAEAVTTLRHVAACLAPHWACMRHLVASRVLEPNADGGAEPGAGGGAALTVLQRFPLPAVKVVVGMPRSRVEAAQAARAEFGAARGAAGVDVGALVRQPSPLGTPALGLLLAPVLGVDVEANLACLRVAAAAASAAAAEAAHAVSRGRHGKRASKSPAVIAASKPATPVADGDAASKPPTTPVTGGAFPSKSATPVAYADGAAADVAAPASCPSGCELTSSVDFVAAVSSAAADADITGLISGMQAVSLSLVGSALGTPPPQGRNCLQGASDSVSGFVTAVPSQPSPVVQAPTTFDLASAVSSLDFGQAACTIALAKGLAEPLHAGRSNCAVDHCVTCVPVDRDSAKGFSVPTLAALLGVAEGQEERRVTRGKDKGRRASTDPPQPSPVDACAAEPLIPCSISIGKGELRLEQASNSEPVQYFVSLYDSAGRRHMRVLLSAPDKDSHAVRAACANAVAVAPKASVQFARASAYPSCPQALVGLSTQDEVLSAYSCAHPTTLRETGRVLVFCSADARSRGSLIALEPLADVHPSITPGSRSLQTFSDETLSPAIFAPVSNWSRCAYYPQLVGVADAVAQMYIVQRFRASAWPFVANTVFFDSVPSATAFDRQLKLFVQQLAREAAPVHALVPGSAGSSVSSVKALERPENLFGLAACGVGTDSSAADSLLSVGASKTVAIDELSRAEIICSTTLASIKPWQRHVVVDDDATPAITEVPYTLLAGDVLPFPDNLSCISFLAVLGLTQKLETSIAFGASHEFVLHPQADPHCIALEAFGARKLSVPATLPRWRRLLDASLTLDAAKGVAAGDEPLEFECLPLEDVADPSGLRPPATRQVYVLASKADLSARQIASVTKVMTFIVILGISDSLCFAASATATAAATTTDPAPASALAPLSPFDFLVRTRVKISSHAAGVVGGTVAKVVAGEEFSAWDLLHGMMLPSGNDAATALAEHFGGHCAPAAEEEWTPYERAAHYSTAPHYAARTGALPRFVAQMNRTALALGMTDTVFANPHGLVHRRHRSTAVDVVRMLAAAMSDARFRRVVGTTKFASEHAEAAPRKRTATRPARLVSARVRTTHSASLSGVPAAVLKPTRKIRWANTNELLPKGAVAGAVRGVVVDGIKTGITPNALGCLTTHAIGTEPSRLIAAAAGGDDTGDRSGAPPPPQAALFEELFCVTLGSRNKLMRCVDNQRILEWCMETVRAVQYA